MYILKNALTSIKRNLGRNILIGIIVMVITCFLTVTLAIKNTSDSLINSYKEASVITASISFNRNNMMNKFEPSSETNFENMKEEFASIESFTFEDIENYGNSKYVKEYYYTASLGVNSDIEAASSDFSFGGKGNNGINRGQMKNGENNTSTDFTLMGYSSITAMQEFITGAYTLSDYDEEIWNKILVGNYCLINSELSTLNSISIGDTIEVISPSDEDITYSLEVIGIYTENSNETTNEMSMFSKSANNIITNTNLVSEISESDEDLKVTITPYFTLTSNDVIEVFSAELSEKGLNENYQVTTNESEIESATSSISNVATFANTFLIITLIIGAIVLLIINFINIRERKYEIGVLRTIGMKKSLVAIEFVTELVIVSFVGLVLGAGIGASISKPVSNSLLSSEINSSKENTENISNNFGGGKNKENMPNMDKINLAGIGGVAKIEAFDSINAVVNIKVIVELIAICLLLTLISSLTAIINIVRFSPLDILKERT